MTRFNVSSAHPTTGAVHTIQVNSASEALAAEDGLLESGYINVEITTVAP